MLRNERGQAATIIMVFLVALVVVAVIFDWWQSRPQEKISILETIFDERELLAGQTTNLTVKIKNMSDKSVASNVSVMINPLDPSVVKVESENPIVIGTLGPGEERLPKFSISIVQNAMKGTYTVKVSVSSDPPLQGDNREDTLTVK